MYSDKENVNILTSLLVNHGVNKAIVCPGSRNAPIVHNLNECLDIQCYPVTDERSAGFYALGMAQATDSPVVVCVTSGTALLNLLPAVAEAFYQHIPLIVVSADRPAQWINQLDGQTIPQNGALNSFVKKSINIPEFHDEEERWYCNRMINDALISCACGICGPVHINVPITEPLYEFTKTKLPVERKIEFVSASVDTTRARTLMLDRFKHASRPMIVIGQCHLNSLNERLSMYLKSNVVVLIEPLSAGGDQQYMDEIVRCVENDERYFPDFILYIGDCIVSKSIKKFLRKVARTAEVWMAREDGKIADTLMNAVGVIEGNVSELLDNVKFDKSEEYYHLWHDSAEVKNIVERCRSFVPEYSQMYAVKSFEEAISHHDVIRHYANSMSVRLGCIYSKGYMYVNRGINGIEGSLSTAAGYSLASDRDVYCVIGDLSFFYDQNALWNRNIGGNFKILLLNNGGGAIFGKFEGLKDSNARDNLVMAKHDTSAVGICSANHINYIVASNAEELKAGLDKFINMKSDSPTVLEVFTDAENDMNVIKEYYTKI